MQARIPSRKGRVQEDPHDHPDPRRKSVCRQNLATLDTLRDDGVVIKLVHAVPPAKTRSRAAALAAICAEKEGKLAAMHRQLMTSASWRDGGALENEALAVGIADTGTFRSCMRSTPAMERLQLHWTLTKELRINGTPTYASRQGVLAGYQTLEELRSVLR